MAVFLLYLLNLIKELNNISKQTQQFMVVNKAKKKSRLLLSFKAAGCIEDSQPATIVLSEVKSTYAILTSMTLESFEKMN